MTNIFSILGLCVSSSLGCFLQPTRNITRSHEVSYDYYTINYKYESNEVNSINDLVDGNIYNFTINQEPTTTQYYGYVYAVYDAESNLLFSVDLESNNSSYLTLFQSGSSKNIIIQDQYSNITFYTIYATQISYPYSFKVVYKSGALSADFYSEVQLQDIPIESVSSTYHNSSIFGFVYDFINNEILTIPNIDNYSFEVFGHLTSLRSWLSISICVVLAILLIALLVWFIRYLFRLFSGLLH